MTPELTAAIARLDKHAIQYSAQQGGWYLPGAEDQNANTDVTLVLDELRRLQAESDTWHSLAKHATFHGERA